MMKSIDKNTKEKIIAYTAIVCEIACLVFGAVTLNVILVTLAAILAFASFIIFKTWDIIENVVFNHTNIVQLFNGYELSMDRFNAIRKIGNKFSATSAAIIKLSEKNVEKAKLENIIANLNLPFKIIIQIEKINVEKIIDNLKTKLYLKRIAVSKLENDTSKNMNTKIEQLKKQIEAIEQDIHNINSGAIPLNLAYYVMCSSMAENRFFAEEQSKHNIKNITNQFNAIFSSDANILSGSDLLKLLEFDSEMVF